MKTARYLTGLYDEAFRRLVLHLKGYRILKSLYKSPLGEIDIVTMKGKTIAVIEVKARAAEHEAAEAILPRQRQRLERGALDFLGKPPHLNQYNLRFDIMLVASRRLPKHIEDAWRPEF